MAKGGEVELVIRARDAATKAIDAVKGALAELTDAQQDAGKSAGKTDTLLGALGKQIGILSREAAALNNFGKIAGELDKAGAAVGRLESGLRGSTTEFARLARESEAAATSTARLRGQIDAEQQAIRENTAERVAARKALTEANRELRQAERNQERYNKAVAATPETKRPSAVRSAGAFIAADLDQSRAAQAQLAQQVTGFENAITASRQAVAELQPRLKAVAAQETALAIETEKAAGAVERQRGQLARARTELGQIEGVAAEAGTALGGLAVNQDKVAAASARMAAQLAQTKARLDALQAAPKVTATVNTSGQAEGLEKQRRAYLEARREWSAAETEVRRLAQAMRDAGTPTTELATAFGQAQAQARLAKDAYVQQRAALAQLGGAAQGGFRAFEQSAQRMQQTAAAMRPIALGASVAGISLERTAGQAQRFAQSVRSAGDGARQSASSFQTLHGSVLGLASAFGGLYAAGNQVAGILKSFQSVETAQSRLGVVFGGDQERVGKELDFIGRQAQRLANRRSCLRLRCWRARIGGSDLLTPLPSCGWRQRHKRRSAYVPVHGTENDRGRSYRQFLRPPGGLKLSLDRGAGCVELGK